MDIINFLIETLNFYGIKAIIFGFILLMTLTYSLINIWNWYYLTFALKIRDISKLKGNYVKIRGEGEDLESDFVINKRERQELVGDSYKVTDFDDYSKNFYLYDNTGSILIKPKGALLNVPEDEEKVNRNLIYSHYKIKNGEEIEVIGNLYENKNGRYIAKSKKDLFIISNQKKNKFIKKYANNGFIALILFSLVATILISLVRRKWTDEWKGIIYKKDTYRADNPRGGGKQNYRIYVLYYKNQKGRFKVNVSGKEYDSVFIGDSVIKEKYQYNVKTDNQ